MDRARFDQRAELVVDVCPSHGIWMDAGELSMVLEYVSERKSGYVPESAAAREENEKWNRIDQSLANEARIVDANIAAAQASSQRSGGGAAVIAATAVGGPWLGLFVALRNRTRR